MTDSAGGIETLLARMPDHWTRSRVRYVCRVETGSRDTVEASDDGEYPFFVRSPQVERIETYSYDTEAVLTAGDGDVGKVFHHYTGKFDAHQRVYVFKDFKSVLGRFFYYWFSNEFHHVTDQGTAESTVASLRRPMIVNFPVPVPPLGEQRTIADFLDRETAQIDAMVDAQERLVTLLEERRASLVDELLIRPGDPARVATGLPWLPSVPASVDLVALKRVLAGIDQGVSPQADSTPAGPGEWGVLTAGCVNGGRFSDEKQKRLDDDFAVEDRHVVRVGDLIVSRASGSRKLVGSAGLVEQNRFNLILSDKTFRLRVASGTSKRFLYWFLNSNIYRHQVEGSISGAEGLANNLPLSALRNFQVPLPGHDEQERIARRLDQEVFRIDSMLAKARESIALMKERRSALISAAVTGRIDVRTGIEQVERDLEEARA